MLFMLPVSLNIATFHKDKHGVRSEQIQEVHSLTVEDCEVSDFIWSQSAVAVFRRSTHWTRGSLSVAILDLSALETAPKLWVQSFFFIMSVYTIPPPPPMNVKDDVSTNWKLFRQAWEYYVTATELNKKSKEVQAGALCSVMGLECVKLK